MGEENFDNHVLKCRCCLKDLKSDEQQINITKKVEENFFELTQIHLKKSNKYSQYICGLCNIDLERFSGIKKTLIEKQQKLYEFVEGRPKRKVKSKKSSHEIDEDKKVFVKLEVKEEQVLTDENCIVIEPFIKTEYNEIEKDEGNLSNFQAPDHILDTNFTENNSDNSSDNDSPDQFDEFFKSEKKRKKKINKGKQKKQQLTKYSCQHCTKFFYLEKNLQVHIDKVHVKCKNFRCDICGFRTYSSTFLEGHYDRVHSENKIVKPREPKQPCPICGLLVQKISTHIRNVHTKPQNVFCDICGIGIYNVNRLRRHMYKHLSKETKKSLETYYCDLCGSKIHSKSSLRSHFRNIHRRTGEEFVCYCGKSYKALNYLKIHQKSAHERRELNFVCSFCGKAFFNKAILKDHIAIHERNGRKDFTCHVCGKMYGSENLLMRHSIFHTSPTLPCSYCGRKFHRKCLLVRHIKRQHEVDEKDCKYCGKLLNVLSLGRHIKEFHSGLTRSQCPVPGCTTTHLRRSHLKDHIRRMHKEFTRNLNSSEKEQFEQTIDRMNLI